ncbi:MAG TPA: ammonium transporter [Spirochaetota bacterium]|nr:ammonium transporter [Spirochaetota bacterium]
MDKTNVDILWIIIASSLVFIMQAGFSFVESGLTRSKNSINVAIKNLTDLGVSVTAFWIIGFALMFGASASGIIGTTSFFTPFSSGVWIAAFFLFQAMFCSTSATIVSGAVAERMKYSSYIISTVVISAIIYPVSGHWAWGGAFTGVTEGWLGKMGFIDFAGSTVVHSVGGWVALAILFIIGPRTGRFSPDGTVNKINGSSIPTATVGVMLLWFGWFGFNGGSTLAMNQDVAGIIMKTVLAASTGMVATLIAGWAILKYPDVNLVINGTLAGLVAITAPCHVVNDREAALIGAVGGLIMFGISILLQRFRIDDAVDAIPVHLGAGAWGTLSVAFFGDPALINNGLSFTGQLAVQALGIVSVGAWAFGITYIFLYVINRLSPLRVTADNETSGLNVAEHGATTEIFDLYTVMDRQSRTGDLSLRVPVEPFTEVGQIADRYNQVIASLEENLVAKSDYVSILDNVSDGLFLMNRENIIAPHYSSSLENIFEKTGLSGTGFDELIKSLVSEKDYNSFLEYSALLFDGKISFRTLDRLNPLKKIDIHIDNRKGGFILKHIECSFLRIMEEDTVARVMAIVRDVTAETELASEMEKVKERSQSEMQMFYRILRIEPAMFIEFLASLEDNISRINEILENEKGGLKDMLNEIYRYVHAIKGDANLFELDFLARKAHNFESRIDELLGKENLENSDFLSLAVMVSELHNTVSQMQTLINQILSFQKDFTAHNSGSEELIVFSVRNMANRIASKAGKLITVDSKGFEILNIPPPIRRKVKEALVQLTRNSVIHGIETPDERNSYGKNVQGKITIAASKNDNGVRIIYRDDGRGIDFDSLKNRAVNSGKISREEDSSITREKLIELMFQPGFSTAESADLNAGRGVGMFLVRRIISEMNGRITVKTKKGEFCEFEFAIPVA